MKRVINQIITLQMLLACVFSFGACSVLDDEESDPESVATLVGTWKGKGWGTGRWRVIFREDMTARVTNYEFNAMGKKVLVISDSETDWSAHGNNFDLGYYWGHIVSDNEISFNARLVNNEDIRMQKVSSDNLDDQIEEQEEEEKKEEVMTSMTGLWEGLSNDGTYVRSLELTKQDNGSFSSTDIFYYADGGHLPGIFYGWDIDLSLNTFLLYGSVISEDGEEGQLNLEDSVITLPTVTLRKTTKPVNEPLTVRAATGVWTDGNNARIELNADMTASYEEDGVTYSYDGWRTAGNEVQLFYDGRDNSIYYMTRLILSGDELILFPGFAGSRRFSRATE